MTQSYFSYLSETVKVSAQTVKVSVMSVFSNWCQSPPPKAFELIQTDDLSPREEVLKEVEQTRKNLATSEERFARGTAFLLAITSIASAYGFGSIADDERKHIQAQPRLRKEWDTFEDGRCPTLYGDLEESCEKSFGGVITGCFDIRDKFCEASIGGFISFAFFSGATATIALGAISFLISTLCRPLTLKEKNVKSFYTDEDKFKQLKIACESLGIKEIEKMKMGDLIETLKKDVFEMKEIQISVEPSQKEQLSEESKEEIKLESNRNQKRR